MNTVFSTIILIIIMSLSVKAYPTFEEKATQLMAQKTEIDKTLLPKPKSLDIYDLRDLLRDSDPQIRKAAIKNSKKYILNSTIYEEVLEIYINNNERLDIRYEAAKALSYATQINKVREEIIEAIKYNKIPYGLKSISYKALWTGCSYYEVKDFLKEQLKYKEMDTQMRKAIIWAMFSCSKDSNIQDVLVDIIKYGNDDISVKVEAVKSLYQAMHDWRVKDLVYDIAKYKTSPQERELRKTSIFALSAVNGDSRIKDFLEDLVKYSDDNELKELALKALNPDPFEIYDFFHLSYVTQNGDFFNPIEKE